MSNKNRGFNAKETEANGETSEAVKSVTSEAPAPVNAGPNYVHLSA